MKVKKVQWGKKNELCQPFDAVKCRKLNYAQRKGVAKVNRLCFPLFPIFYTTLLFFLPKSTFLKKQF